MNFVSKKIKEQEKSNEQIVLDYWKQVSESGNVESNYESLVKKMVNISEEESLSPKQFAYELLKLEDIARRQVLKYWVIKAERQNLNEVWKKEYIESKTKIITELLPKSGLKSLHLDDNFNITPKKSKKRQSDKSTGVKTFDFIILNSKFPKTEGFNGILTVDKTVKVTGGSQMDVQKEIDYTISHLCMDPFKRKYLILLDGEFFYKYVQEKKGKCDNIFFSTTDELIEINKKNI